MPTYTYTGEVPALVPALGREVQPGESFDSDEEIDSPAFAPAKGPKPKPAEEVK